jgi:hypothetical protein
MVWELRMKGGRGLRVVVLGVVEGVGVGVGVMLGLLGFEA